MVYRHSFVGGVLNDDYGHGTHVAGIAAGNGHVSSGAGSFRNFKGIAPNANLLDLRVLDQNSAASDSAVIAAIQQAVQLKNQYNVRVINLSLGRRIWESCTRDPLCQAVEAAWNSGIVVVVAAGNLGRNGYATVLSPGNSPHAITVGAMKAAGAHTNTDDNISSYSSKGPTYIDQTAKPDLVAPGNQVVSLLAPGSTLVTQAPANVVYPSYYTSSGSSGVTAGVPQYLRLSGTSMATPVVSGTVALLLQKNPSLSPDTVKARLMKTASKTFPLTSVWIDPATGIAYPSTDDLFTVGAGYLNIATALANTDVATRSAASPKVGYKTLTPLMTLAFASRTLTNSSNSVTGSAVSGNTVPRQRRQLDLERATLVWGHTIPSAASVVNVGRQRSPEATTWCGATTSAAGGHNAKRRQITTTRSPARKQEPTYGAFTQQQCLHRHPGRVGRCVSTAVLYCIGIPPIGSASASTSPCRFWLPASSFASRESRGRCRRRFFRC